MNKLPAPEFIELIEHASYIVTWHDLEHECSQHHNNHTDAYQQYSHHFAQWLLQPLKKWLKQHEHLAMVQVATSPRRKKAMGLLLRTSAMFFKAERVQAYVLCNWLQTQGLADFRRAMPGVTSRYRNHSEQLHEWLQQQSHQYILANTPPQKLFAHEN
jgi:hypothetical protein